MYYLCQLLVFRMIETLSRRAYHQCSLYVLEKEIFHPFCRGFAVAWYTYNVFFLAQKKI